MKNINILIFLVCSVFGFSQDTISATQAKNFIGKEVILKGKIASSKLKLDMYQKSKAEIQGDCTDMKLRLDNDAEFDGKKMASKTLELTAEAKSNCKVNTNGDLAVSASGKAEIEIYGQPKIEIKKFADEATLKKKSKQ